MKIQFTNFLKTITTLKSIEPTTSHNTFYTDLLNNNLHALKYHILNSNTVSIKISKLYLNNPSIYKHRERQSVLKQVRDILSEECVKLVDVGYVLYFMCSDIYLGMIYNGNGNIESNNNRYIDGNIEGNNNRCIDGSIEGNNNRCIDGYIEGNNNRYMDESIEGNGIESIEENINRYMDGNIEENNKRYMDGNIKGNNNRCIDDIYGHIEDMYIDNYKNQLSINNKLYSLLINIYNTSYQIESILHTTTYPLNIPNNLLKFKKVRDHLLNNLYNLDFYTVQDIYLKYLIFHTQNNQFIKCIDLLIEYQYNYIIDFYSEYIKEKESEILEGLRDKERECSNIIISINNNSPNNIYRNTTSINNNSSNNIYNNITSSNNINSHNNNIYNNIHSSSNDTSKNNINSIYLHSPKNNSISINTILKIFKYIYKSSNSIKPKTMKHFSIFLNNTNFTSNTTHERMSIVPYLLDLYSLKTKYSFKYILYLIRLYFNRENNLVIDNLRNKVLRDLKSINRERDIGNDILVYVENNRITIENKLLDIYNQVDEDSSGHEDCYSRIDGDCSGHEDCYSRIDGDCYNDIRSCYNRVNGDYFRGIKSCYSKVNVIEDGVEENIYERHNDINNRLDNDKVNSFITTNTISLINKNHIKILIKYIKIFINIIESFNQFQYLEYKSKVDDIFNILKYIYNLKIKYIKDRFYNKIRELVIDLYKSVMSNERKNICSDNMNLSIGNDNRNVYSDNMNLSIDNNNNMNCSIDNINLRFDNNNRNEYSDNMNCNIDDNINCNSIKDIIDNIFYNLLLNEEIRNIYLINKKFPRRVLKNVKINIRNKKERTLYRYIRKIYKEKVDEVKDEFIILNENLLNINEGTMNVEGNIDLEDISNIGEDIMNKEDTLNIKDIINVGNTMNNKDIINSGITTKDNFIKDNNNKNSQIKDNNRKKSHDKYNNNSQIKDNDRKKSHDKYNNNSQIKDKNNKKYHFIDKNETTSSLSTSSSLSILTSISTSLSLSFKTLKNIKIIHNFTKHDTILSPILISIKKTLLLLYKKWSTLSKHQRHNLIKIYPVIYKYCKMYKIEICKEIKKSLTLVWKLNLPILKYKHIKLFVDEMSSLREYEDKKEIINIHKEVYETIERYKVDYEMKIKDRNVLEREVLYRNVLERDVHREVLDMKVVEGKIYSDDKDEKRETGKIVDISKLMKTDDKDEKIVDRNNKYKIESSIEDEIIKSDKLSSSIKSLSLIQDLIQHINNSLREQLNYFYKIQSYLLSTSKIYTDTEFNNKIYQIINILNSKQILLEDIIKYKNYDLIQNFLKLKLEDLYTKHNLYKNKVLKKIQELKIRFSKLYFVSDEDLLKGKYRDIIRNIYFVDDILISSDDKDFNEGICSINGNGYKNCNCIDNQNEYVNGNRYVNDNGINIDQINIKKSYDNINSTYYCIGIISKGEEFIFINRIPLDNTLEFLIEFDKEFQYSLNEYYKKKRVDISIIRDTILEVEYFKSVERTLRDGDMIEGDLKDDKEECGDFRNGDMIEGDFKDSKEEVEYFRNGDLIEEDFREGDLIKGDLKDDKKVERHENTNKDCMEEKYANKDCMKEEIAIQNNNNLVLSNSILNNIKPYKTTTSKIKYLRKYKNNYYTINPSNIYYYPPSSIIYTSLTNTIFNKISLSRNKHFILYGESSTGKTETVKYYCRSIGKQVYVFCCNELITLDLLNNIIHGCRINGYYLCMDEFNRLNMEVITKLEFPDDLFVFITVNLGYLGRVDIFDCVDDNERVCEDVNENGHKDNVNGSAIDDEVNKSSIYDNENNIDCSVKKLINYNNNNSINNTSIDNNNNNINLNKSTSINNNNIKDIYQIRNDLLNTMYSKNSNTFMNKCTLIRVDNPNIKDIILDTINKELIPVLFDIIDTFNITLTLRSLKYFSTLTNIYYYVYSSLNENDRDRFTNKYKIKRPSYKKLLEYGLKYSNGVILVGETKTGKSLLIREYLNVMEEVNINGLNCEYKDEMNDGDVHSNINSIHKSQSTIDLNSDSNINTSIHNINDTTSNKNLTQNTNGTINITLYKYFYKYDELELYNYIKSIDNFNITRYIIYDCVLDSRWIENLNSVLDDNKILCIKTGETVRVDNIKFIFESNDLSLLTPATLTRVFVVNMYEDSSGDSVCNCNGNGIIECNCEVYDNKDKYISGYKKCNTGNNMIENICSDKKSNKRNIMIENKIKSIYSDKKTFHNIATLDIKSIKDKNQLLEILHEQRVIFIEGELGVGKRAYVNNLICQYNGELDEGNRDCLNNNNLLENNKNGNMVDGKIDKGSKVNEESINEKIGSYNRILSINNNEQFTQCNTSIPSTNSNSIKSTNNNIHSTNDSGRSLNDNIHTIDSSMKSIKYNIDNNVHFIYKSIKEIYSLDKLKSYKYYILDDYEDCTIDVYEEIRLLYEYNTLNIFLIILYNGTNLLEINKKRRIKFIIFQMIRNTTNESKMEYDNNTSKTINKYNDECILEQINFYLKRQIKLIILGEYLSGKAYIINRLENRDKVSCSKSKSLEESGTINNCITNNGTINNCITNNDNNNNINDNTNLIIKTYDINEINKQERRNRHIIKIEQYPYLVHLDEILENDYENILKYVKNIELKECGCCILKYTKEIFYVEDDLFDKNKDGICKVANNKDMACDRTIHKDFHINEYTLLEDNSNDKLHNEYTLLEDNFNDKLHNDNIIYKDNINDKLHNDNIIYKDTSNDKLHSDKIVCKNIPFFNLCSSIDGNKIILENKYKLYEFIHTTKKMYRNKKIIDEQIKRQRKIIEDKLEREREIYAEKINNCKIDIDKSLDVLKNRHTKDLVNVKTLILSNIDKIRNVLKIKNNYSKIKKELEEQQIEVKLNLESMNNDIKKLVEKKREFSDKLGSIENKLKESYNKIMKINKKNLAELKSMNSPPLVVVYVVRVLKELLSCEEIVDEININSNGVDCSGNLCNDVMVDGNLCNGNNESLNSKFLDSLEHSTDDKKNSSSIEHSKNRKHKNNEFINNYKNKSNSSNFKKSTESWTSLKAFLRNADFINNLINVNTSSLSTITLNELRSKEQEIFKSSKICYIFYEYIVNKSEYDKIKQINSNINEDINKHDIEINKLSKLVQDEMKKDKEIKRQLFEIEQVCDESENELKLEENENILKEINFIKENSINIEISNCNITNNGIAMNRKENNSLDNKESLAMINNSLENNNTISLDTTVINNINKNTNLVDKDNIVILKDSANSTTINNSEYLSRSNIIDNINIKHFSTILNIEDIQYEYIQYTNCILLYLTLNINNSLIKDYIITDTRDSNFYTVLENTMKFKNNLIIKNVLKFDKSVYNLCKYQIENKTFKLVLEDVNSNYTHVGYFYNSFSILYNNRVSAKNNLNIHNEDILNDNLNIKSCEMLSCNKLLGGLLNGNKKLLDDILNGNELYNSIVDDNKFLEDYLDNHTIRKNQTMLNNLNSVLLKDRNPTSKEIAHQNIQLSSLKEFYETLLESNNNYKKINILHRKKYNLDLSRYVFNINNTKSYCLGEDFNILKSTDINYSHLILTNREEIIWYLKKINNKHIKISKKVYYIKNTRIIDLRDKFNKELFYEMCIEEFDCIEEDKCNNSKEYISSGNSNEYLNSNMNCKNNGIENSTTGYPYLCKNKIFSRCIEDNKDTINLHKYKNTLNNKLMCRHYIIKIHCDILENIYKFNLYNKYKLNKKDLEFMLNNYKTVNLKYLIELVYVNKIDIEDYKKVMDGI